MDFATWNMLTGLPREAYEEWLQKDPVTRADIVGMFQDPEAMDEVREIIADEQE